MQPAKNLDPIVIGIRKIITEKGLLQKSVAARAGYTEQQLSDMLNNRKIIKACDLLQLSEALGVEVSDLLDKCKPAQLLEFEVAAGEGKEVREMLDDEMRTALANEIAYLAIKFRDRQPMITISSDMEDDERTALKDALVEHLRHPPRSC